MCIYLVFLVKIAVGILIYNFVSLCVCACVTLIGAVPVGCSESKLVSSESVRPGGCSRLCFIEIDSVGREIIAEKATIGLLLLRSSLGKNKFGEKSFYRSFLCSCCSVMVLIIGREV